jgi:hypothetical protein
MLRSLLAVSDPTPTLTSGGRYAGGRLKLTFAVMLLAAFGGRHFPWRMGAGL